MSLTALLVATRDYLRTELAEDFTANEIMVMPQGRPPPDVGQQFIGIFGSAWNAPMDADDMPEGWAEEYAISATLTVRSPSTPLQAHGDELYIKTAFGMETTCRRMAQIVHGPNKLIDYSLMQLADSLVEGPDKFTEYLRWISTDPQPIPVDSMWFWVAPMPESFEHAQAGMIMTVRWGRCTRLQYHRYADDPNFE